MSTVQTLLLMLGPLFAVKYFVRWVKPHRVIERRIRRG